MFNITKKYLMFAVVVSESMKTVLNMDGRTTNDNSEKSYKYINSRVQ